MNGPASRRGFIASLAAVAGLGSTGAALAISGPAQPHPDAALIEAGRELVAAEQAFKDACASLAAACRAVHRDHGPVPEVLVYTTDERAIACGVYGSFGPFGDRLRPHSRRRPGTEDTFANPDPAWSSIGLGIALRDAVSKLGRGGRTPHHIRRWRALLPVAIAYEERVADARARHRSGFFDKEEKRAHARYEAVRGKDLIVARALMREAVIECPYAMDFRRVIRMCEQAEEGSLCA